MQQTTENIQKELAKQASRKGKANKHGNSATTKQSYWWLRRQNILTHALCPTQNLFSYIVQTIHKYLREAFFEGHSIYFPHGMGELTLAQHKLVPNYEEGYLGNNLPIDWAATRKLWSEDEEARKKKQLIRCTNRVMYRIVYNRRNTHYTNKELYGFAPCRIFQRELAQKAKNNEVSNTLYNYSK